MNELNLAAPDYRLILDIALAVLGLTGLSMAVWCVWTIQGLKKIQVHTMHHLLGIAKTSNNVARLVCHKLGISEAEAKGIIEQLHNEAEARGEELP